MNFDEKLFNEIMKSKAPQKLLIVPAQLTLSAEEAAFDVLGRQKNGAHRGFFDFHVMSGNKLRSEILGRIGAPKETLIDALGKSMVLRRCASELSKKGGLEAFSSVINSDSFLDSAKDFIIQTKQNNAEDLTAIADEGSMLSKKLCDMQKILAAYETCMKGKYIDSEDGLLYVTEKLSECDWIKNSELWFVGFYSFTKREQVFLAALDKNSFGCHVMLSSPVEKLPESFSALIEAETTNAEADIIASEILRLIREEKYSAEDIVILSANLNEDGPVLKRVFDSLGIRCFVDEKRSMMHQAAPRKISLLLDIIADGFKTNTVIQFVEDEDFENYCKSYHIKGDAFLSNFKYGGASKVNAEIKRDEFATLIAPLKSQLSEAETVREKTTALYEFLVGPYDILGKLNAQLSEAKELGYKDYGDEISQIFSVILHIFDQAVELLGDTKITNKEYRDLIKNAFRDIKIGLLPQESNCVMIGDLYRSKITKARALFVTGFNDGCAPRNVNASGILTNEEIEKLSSAGIALCKDLKQIIKEDKIMIFEAFEKATEKLYLSYAFADNDGKEKGESYLLARLLPNEKRSEVKVISKCNGELYSFENLSKVLLDAKHSGSEIPAEWMAAAAKLKEKDPARYSALTKGLLYKNSEIKLTKKETKEILNTKTCSPSSIESYIKCPFAFFIERGIRAEEPIDFSMSAKDSGNVYHEVLDRLSKYLSSDGIPARSDNSRWQKISGSEIDDFVEKAVAEIAEGDTSGLLNKGNEEKFYCERISKNVKRLAHYMIAQVREGNIDLISTEHQFSFDFAGITVKGKIDRVDLTSLENADYIKVIDYKTGSATKFDKAMIEAGKAVQLMLYLEAALGERSENKTALPVGIFYFTIEKDPVDSKLEELAEISEEAARKIFDSYKLDGAYSTDSDAFATIDKNAGALESKKSSVVTMHKTRELSEEDFENLREVFKEKFAASVAKLQSGDVSVRPIKLKGENTACTFCKYKSICRFDLQIEGCTYG